MASSTGSCPRFLLLLFMVCARSAALPRDHPVDPTCPPELSSAVAESSNYRDSEPRCQPPAPHNPVAALPYDVDAMQFALNLEYAKAEFFLHGAYGKGLDQIAPKLALGGPPPVGARKANLDEVTWRTMAKFGRQEVDHVRAIQRTVGGFPRPLIDLRAHNFARVMDEAFGYPLHPPFDPYINSTNFLLAAYVISSLGLKGYDVGTNSTIDGYETELHAGIGLDAEVDVMVDMLGAVRSLLSDRLRDMVPPYRNITVAEFTDRVSALQNRLGRCGVRDEGLTVPRELGAEGCTNLVSADRDSLSYARTPAQLLRIMYTTGSEHEPGGFFPKGANGRIARSFLGKPHGADEKPRN